MEREDTAPADVNEGINSFQSCSFIGLSRRLAFGVSTAPNLRRTYRQTFVLFFVWSRCTELRRIVRLRFRSHSGCDRVRATLAGSESHVDSNSHDTRRPDVLKLRRRRRLKAREA